MRRTERIEKKKEGNVGRAGAERRNGDNRDHSQRTPAESEKERHCEDNRSDGYYLCPLTSPRREQEALQQCAGAVIWWRYTKTVQTCDLGAPL